MSESFLTYQPSFKGEEVILLLCGNQTIEWLIQKFSQPSIFVIGDGRVVESDGNCVVSIEVDYALERTSIRREGKNFRWAVSKESARHYQELLLGMLKSTGPCHQYLESENNASPIFMVSRDEYQIRDFRSYSS